jgi:hypothetical protein
VRPRLRQVKPDGDGFETSRLISRGYPSPSPARAFYRPDPVLLRQTSRDSGFNGQLNMKDEIAELGRRTTNRGAAAIPSVSYVPGLYTRPTFRSDLERHPAQVMTT